MVLITDIDKNGRAAKAGILAGDTLVSINGNAITDVLDYRFYLAEDRVTLSLLRAEGYVVAVGKGRSRTYKLKA